MMPKELKDLQLDLIVAELDMDEYRKLIKQIIAHWNEFGPENGFGELLDRIETSMRDIGRIPCYVRCRQCGNLAKVKRREPDAFDAAIAQEAGND